MHEALTILANHEYWVVFVWVFADQAELPLPSFPVLLAARALAHVGSLNLFAAIALAALAVILIDSFWFELGRHRGGLVLKFICRTALEPESCVGRTQQMFSRRGAWTLVVSKFVPGMNVIAAPMAGISGVSRLRFQTLNAAGSLAFAVLFVLLGYLFSRQLERVLALASAAGHWFLVAVVALFMAYLAIKYARRARFIRLLRVARISSDELRDKLKTGVDIVIVDLRQYGIHQVRPLAGGHETWRQKNFPLTPAAGLPQESSSIPLDVTMAT